jgi:hypothetical protein
VADDNDGFWVGTDDATQHASEETVKLRSREEEDWLDSVDSSAPISPDVEVEWMKALLFVHTMCRSSWGRFAQVRIGKYWKSPSLSLTRARCINTQEHRKNMHSACAQWWLRWFGCSRFFGSRGCCAATLPAAL